MTFTVEAPDPSRSAPAAPAEAAGGSDSLPWWLRVGDLLALAVIGVGVAVYLGGGFRLHIGNLRLSVTSAVTPLVIALLVLGVRHALRRRPTILERIAVQCRTLARADAWRASWAPFAITRAGVLAVGLFAVYTVGYPPAAPPYRTSESELANLPMRWDAGWYYRIARLGYQWDSRSTGQQSIAFFPAYPMMIRGLGRLFGGAPGAYVLAGIAISHGAFLWSLLLLYRLARSELGDETASRAAVLLAACYPFSIFYGAMYTESLFLLGTLGAIVELRRGRFGRAILWGVLVGLTRPNGFLLSATLAVLAYTMLRSRVSRLPVAQWARLTAVVAAPLVGVVLYSGYIASLTGDPVAWWRQHSAWGRTFVGTAPLQESTELVTSHGLEALFDARPFDLLNGAAAAAGLVLVVPVGMRLGLAYAVFLAVNLLPPLIFGGTLSMGRVSSTMFPMFLWLAAAAPRLTTSLAVAFALLQGLMAVLFYTWRPLF